MSVHVEWGCAPRPGGVNDPPTVNVPLMPKTISRLSCTKATGVHVFVPPVTFPFRNGQIVHTVNIFHIVNCS